MNKYTKPALIKEKNGKWYVFFRFEHEGKMVSVKRSEGLNRIKDLREKEADFKALLEMREEWLKRGWNPITGTLPTYSASEKLKDISFSVALDFAIEKKSPEWSKRTKHTYDYVVRILKESAGHLINAPVQSLKRPDYREILEKATNSRGLSAKGFNKYRWVLSALINELLQYDILEYNPVEKIKTKAEIKTVAHREPTQDERIRIVAHVKKHNYNYYRFLCVEYGCSIRPKEIYALKIKNLHKIEQVFRLIPDDQGSTKTKYEREVAIPDWLITLLSELNLHKLNPEWYIFSRDFLPGEVQINRNKSTDTWRKLVKAPIEEGGLNLDINQYALKKLSGNDMIRLKRREGVENVIQIAQDQMGHQSPKMTEVYVDEHKKINQELIKRKMPEL